MTYLVFSIKDKDLGKNIKVNIWICGPVEDYLRVLLKMSWQTFTPQPGQAWKPDPTIS